jgi:hypothetical protein
MSNYRNLINIMKKPVGYKVGGITHFPNDPSFSSVVNSVRAAVSSEMRNAPLNREEPYISTDNEKFTRPIINYKRSPKAT